MAYDDLDPRCGPENIQVTRGVLAVTLQYHGQWDCAFGKPMNAL